MPRRLPTHRPQGAPATTKERHRQYKRDRTDHAAQAFYTSARWRACRAAFLAANPLCVECRAEGRATAATIADHQAEVKDSPELALCFDNLKALCVSHHNAKTGRKVQGMK
jgi:5-methylcytosine-specific restriction protein A